MREIFCASNVRMISLKYCSRTYYDANVFLILSNIMQNDILNVYLSLHKISRFIIILLSL